MPRDVQSSKWLSLAFSLYDSPCSKSVKTLRHPTRLERRGFSSSLRGVAEDAFSINGASK
jgi:hypothetical protein